VTPARGDYLVVRSPVGCSIRQALSVRFHKVAFGAGSNPPAVGESFGIRENPQVCYSDATSVAIVTTNLTPTLRAVREAMSRCVWAGRIRRSDNLRILTPVEFVGHKPANRSCVAPQQH